MTQETKKHPTIALCPCESSRIASYGFDPATGTLALQFKNKSGAGPVYHYQNVTPALFADFEKSDSKGKFFASVFNNKESFPYTRIEDKEEA